MMPAADETVTPRWAVAACDWLLGRFMQIEQSDDLAYQDAVRHTFLNCRENEKG